MRRFGYPIYQQPQNRKMQPGRGVIQGKESESTLTGNDRREIRDRSPEGRSGREMVKKEEPTPSAPDTSRGARASSGATHTGLLEMKVEETAGGCISAMQLRRIRKEESERYSKEGRSPNCAESRPDACSVSELSRGVGTSTGDARYLGGGDKWAAGQKQRKTRQICARPSDACGVGTGWIKSVKRLDCRGGEIPLRS